MAWGEPEPNDPGMHWGWGVGLYLWLALCGASPAIAQWLREGGWL